LHFFPLKNVQVDSHDFTFHVVITGISPSPRISAPSGPRKEKYVVDID